MFLIVGLGNPGAEYNGSRHNVGFAFVDKLLAESSPIGSSQQRFRSVLQKANLQGVEVLFLKPLTFMNISGEAVSECANFFKILPENIVVIFDDLDQPHGAVRARFGGGHGGHNGIRSILDKLGTDKFHRIKIGIGKPLHKSATANWVLSRFSSNELAELNNSFIIAVERLNGIFKQNLSTN